MANRLRVTALVALAMLNAFTLAAGVAVASLLPARLALWQIPRVAAGRPAQPSRVLAPVNSPGSPPGRAGLAAALTPLLASPALGSHVGAVITSLASGSADFSQQATSPFVPASSEKLVTAAAALDLLGPQARFTTRVVNGPAPGSIVLVGGGDPTLAVRRPPGPGYPEPATLAALANATAGWLRAHGRASVRLTYDISLFTGPLIAPGWSTSYISTGNVTPITALAVDQGRLTAAGKPEDADNPNNFRPRSFTPSADAAAAFASLLRSHGIHVAAGVAAAAAPPGAHTIAAVRSPVLSAIVGWMLRESNNVIAEDLARQVALGMHAPASFSGGAAAVARVARRLGVRSGVHLVDGSGLSTRDRISPQALAAVVRAAADGSAGLRPVIAGLPVAGFSGTLAPRQSVFSSFGPAALGMVRAKTGNLSRVVSLAGVVDDASGHLLAFAFMADQLRPRQLASAAGVLDAMATKLASCGCR